MQNYKLYKVGVDGYDESKLHKLQKPALIKVCQDQQKKVEQHAEYSSKVDTFDVKLFEKAIDYLKNKKDIKKL